MRISPPGLCAFLEEAGHEAFHTSQLPAQNRTTDQIINDLSLREQRVVISKDTDFYYSHLLPQKPGNSSWFAPATSAHAT